MTERDATNVVGYCPMGCGPTLTLFLGTGGHITCRHSECPRPDSVSEILKDEETEHLVTFDEEAFTIRHPLRERLDDQLLTCDLPRLCADLSGPEQLGTYRVSGGAGDWSAWTLVDGEVSS